jgi:hypothetical protein
MRHSIRLKPLPLILLQIQTGPAMALDEHESHRMSHDDRICSHLVLCVPGLASALTGSHGPRTGSTSASAYHLV